jgi:transcriptional regulator with XRE-family HTH domain
MAKFGDRLKEARTNKGWNQDKLAEAMELTQASISQFEKGLRLPTPKNIEKFARVLEVPREYFAGKNQGAFEKEMLLRNLNNLSPDSIKKINDYAELIKKSEGFK